MRQICLLFLLIPFYILSQNGISKKGMIKLFVEETNNKNAPVYHSTRPNGASGWSGGGSSKTFKIKYSVDDGKLKRIGANAKFLKRELEKDSAALSDFNKAFNKYYKKKKNCDFVAYTFFGVGIGGLGCIAYGLGSEGNEEILVAGGGSFLIGAIGTFAFQRLSLKQHKKFAKAIENSIAIYNRNL